MSARRRTLSLLDERRDFSVHAVVGLLVLAGMLAGLAWQSEGVRHQVALTMSRQPESFLVLDFPGIDAERSCAVQEGFVAVRFSAVAHGDRAGSVGYQVEVRPEGTARNVTRVAGTVQLADGRPVVLEKRLPVPETAFDVAVSVLDGTEELLVHCQGELS